MKLEQISDPDLRAWVSEYQAKKLLEKKQAKTSADDLVSIWKTYNEADWQAWRDIPDLRRRAAEVFKPAGDDTLGPQTIGTYIQRYLMRFPPIERNGQRYDAPYTIARERAALLELIERDSSTVSEVW